MNVGQVMTRGARTIRPEASLEQAARAMKSMNVGAIPVAVGGRPVGMITDRDIAVRGIAKGLDPAETCVCDIMSGDVIACEQDDPLDAALRVMQDRQIRRLPVVNRRGRIAGILSIGDVAVRTGREAAIARVLEEISRPGRPRAGVGSLFGGGGPVRSGRGGGDEEDAEGGPGFVGEPRVVSSAMSVAALAAGIGAAAMYLTDPARGRRRRALVRDQAAHWARMLSQGLQRAARDAGARARGAVAETRARMSEEPVDDERLCARVRSALGRAVSNPGAVRVEASQGAVTLSGVALAGEIGRLMSKVSAVRGVRSVDNQIQVREQPGATPGLQGARGLDHHGGSAGRVLPLGAGMAGAGLLAWGLARRGPLGLISALAGGTLAVRGLTGTQAGRALGLGGPRGDGRIEVQKTITISRPLGEVFEFFRAYENFPRVMSRVREVRELGSGRSHWIVAGPAGVRVEWDARTIRMDDDREIAWESEPGSMIRNAGTIRFEPAQGGTRVHIRLSYHPPGGVLGHAAAMLFGSDPKSEMDQDLMRAKVLIETGRTPHDAARPMGRDEGGGE